ncbi:MAG: hypothetical protein ACK4HG_10815 [Agrobacterium albertimagni]|uniref:Uncharacterized protein n=2 Tax=Agrobacterium albertimagni TaxID=147266 RepID=K2QQ96_9HYPH|nr:hypothetical protein [Agrobacterium albertimagni]EKF57167.1 hypothetical protein QWE_22546 [Agrobacterium albertimagni AOL15]
MALGEGSARWDDVGDGPAPPDRSDETAIYQSQFEHEGSGSAQTNSGWGPLLAFAAVMAVPFALVAWLMS